ncbi:GMC family oxidoreductase [bacterium]|nr:GMC family oxidoreductase [bacterium]
MIRTEANHHPRRFLSKRQFETVRAFAEVFIEGEKEAVSPQQIARNIDEQLGRIRSKRKNSVKLILFLIEYVMPLSSFRPPFSKMSAKDRKKLIQSKLKKAKKVRFLRDLFRIRALFLSGYYGDARVFKSIGFIPVDQRPRYTNNALKAPDTQPVSLYEPQKTEISCEVCVVGSGAGGAVVAYNAAAAGREVILLEAGEHVRSQEISHDENGMIAKFYKDGGLQSTVDFDMSILQGQSLGGTTVINNAICFRLNDPDVHSGGEDLLTIWRTLGAEIDADQLEAAYGRVEQMIQVKRIPEEIAGENGHTLIRGWKKLVESGQGNPDFKFMLFRKNYNQCLGCGYCNWGCPYGRKFSMLETYIPAASRAGAKVIASCQAIKIEKAGGRATGIRCKYRGEREILIRAKKVVVSCGAIGSSILLMNSGIRKNVGKRFSFNSATPLHALFPHELNSFDGVQMAAYVDAGEFILESLFNPPLGFSVTMPGWFDRHFERMVSYNRFASLGVVVGTENNARVKGSAFFRDLVGPIKYRMTASDLEKTKRGIVLAAKTYFAAGAEAVYPASVINIELKPGDDIARIIGKAIKRPDDLILNSSHPQGGNAMSDHRRIGVVDSRFRVHGYDNLFVCDASVFPTTIRINPQLTIMAMADYFSHQQGWIPRRERLN